MTQAELEALLGRDLTATEVANLTEYLQIAAEKLESLICSTFQNDEESGEEPETRLYEAREGYSTVFTDIFYEITSVSVDGEVRTDYEVRQFDNLNGSWYNSLVFDKKFRCETVITVEGHWGFESMPQDLQLLWARLFGNISKQNSTDSNVKSQRIEDASVTYRDDNSTLSDQLVSDNKATILKYSVCGVGMVRHGKVWGRGYWHGHI